jgi:hypothetical protein
MNNQKDPLDADERGFTQMKSTPLLDQSTAQTGDVLKREVLGVSALSARIRFYPRPNVVSGILIQM